MFGWAGDQGYRILWSTNFPLATSSWPGTKEVIDRCFQDVSTETPEQLL